jgi:hypothetical protein
MTQKTFKILLPAVAGLLFVLMLLQLRQTLADRLYPTEDAVFPIDPLFDIIFLLPLYSVVFAVSLLIQLFITSPVWHKYRKSRKVPGFKLWELTGLACLLFGSITGLLKWYSPTGFMALTIQIFTWTGLAISYWVINFLILNCLDKKQFADQSWIGMSPGSIRRNSLN